MPRLTRVHWIAVLIAFALGVALGLRAVARLADGPIGPIPGGPFRSGELAPDPEDWSFLADTRLVELQLVDPPRSVTTHIVVSEREAYVPCGIVKAGPFVFLGQAPWKRWPYQVADDPRVILRSHGKLYERRAVRVTDPGVHRTLSSLVSIKYQLDLEDPPDLERAWFFRLEPR